MIDFLQYYRQLENSLDAILHYWSVKMVDEAGGGFYGRRDGNDRLYPDAEKGSVLNSRILWAFSAAYNAKKKPEWLQLATRAYAYIVAHFTDKDFGGIYWSVDAKGNPLNTRKQIYGQAFAIYGLSEYFIATNNKDALNLAIELFHLIEEKSYDKTYTGYFEAYTRNWELESDLRLSEKDDNAIKSMNTHLHVVEAYAALYRIWKADRLRQSIKGLLDNFSRHIIDPVTHHQKLFFDEQWHSHHAIVSYGHDIEAAWLLQEAAEIAGFAMQKEKMREYALLLADAAAEGLDRDGGLWCEKEGDQLLAQKHWWPQAESMVGFYNAYQVSGDTAYLQKSLHSWQFIQEHLLDRKNGEWYWGIYANGKPMLSEDKAGFWKCPYHNTRACLEVMRRIKETQTIEQRP